METYLFYVGQQIEKLRKSRVPRKFTLEITHCDFWRAVFCELVGTFLFHFIGCASVTYWSKDHDSRDIDAASIKISFAFGLAIMGVIEIVGPMSGAHLNPAVSVGFAISRHTTPLRTVVYIIAQCIGAIASSAFLYGITPPEYANKLGGNGKNPHITVWSAFATEIFLTYFLMTIIYAATNPRRQSRGNPAIVIGLTVAALHLGGITYGSCGMNPARSLGPALFSHVQHWDDHWIYWIGPMLGAIFSSVTYKYLIDPYNRAKTVEETLSEIGKIPPPNESVPSEIGTFRYIDVDLKSSKQCF